MLNIGIIGTGGMGGRHAENIHAYIRGARVAALGVAAVIWHVPMGLALAHQVVAVLALVVATVHASDAFLEPLPSPLYSHRA